ncbi:MAG: succinate dehydrogenase/fumarate reductase iron-sulfur subunit [Deltaproteobacteria bacterium]|nr:succinate dehydrogenase/fumarate reductase iron-sulfur subunit [Deltaproteobacteria bacterium]MBW1954135.1 succinate dehydrogenase/fumarate reductase iron-sulfur subunit [Deltaproteobacteria bacterium]MBW2041025.1 succinate dehydrogenase/fumarate reductase iron-sulfur subunit [Deltaproteobacteria bacterium]MBW2131330.1 succinate dehydrogenase/fumarate reductase iron-sulfur subunit [Deltaproteobacteria bacterium]
MKKSISLTLKVWRQAGSTEKGSFETYAVKDISTDMSFLEMLDVLNEDLTREGKPPIAFDHDCREGICGMCGAVVNGRPHGPEKGTTLCQLHMRHFSDNDELVIEPWRSRAFPVVKDLVVDRSPLERIIIAGGYISVNTGSAPEANSLPVPQEAAEKAMDAAACIGCGACVAACPNGSAMLFTSAKISHLALLPQGRPEAARRAIGMVQEMDRLGFGNCSNITECQVECPKEVSISNIARLNREFMKAWLAADEK